MKHCEATEGPWIVTHQTDTDNSWDIVANGLTIATTGKCAWEGSEVAANARLIALAPDLLLLAIKISRSACLQQESNGKCICFACEAKRLLKHL